MRNQTAFTSIAIACLAFVPMAGAAYAQAPAPAPQAASPAPLSVEDAVALAVRQNPRLSAAARDIGAARSGVRSARALANPSVVFTPGLTSSGGSDEELLLQQPLELNGTRSARTGVAQAQLKQTQAEAVVELRNLVAQTKSSYYELARNQELRNLSADVLKTTEEFARITRRLVEVGTRPEIEVTQIEIEVTRARQQLTLAESQVATNQAALNTLMGRPANEPVGALSPLATSANPADTVPTVPADREETLRQALSARAEITIEAALREQFRQQGRLARAEGRPDLAPQFRAGSVTRGFSDSGVGLGITLPFLDYGSRRNRIRQTEIAARAQQDRITSTQNQVRQEVEQSLAQLAAAERVIQDYRAGVLDQSRRLLNATQIGFQSGLYNLIQVLEAQRSYRAVQTDYINALVARAQARAELERATGAVPESLLPTYDGTRPTAQGMPK